MNRTMILIRHGTAEKNDRNEHGGSGTSLTDEGISEVEEAGDKLVASKIEIDSIYCTNKPQCTESASILSKILHTRHKVLESIEPFCLGVLDGLSEEQANSMYPEVSREMELWRKGEIDISQLYIPGSSNPVHFVSTCKEILIPLLTNDTLIVGTRSILVAFASILLGRQPVRGGGYIEIPWRNAAFTVFKENGKKYLIDSDISTNIINQ